jgi:hypothetical protein
MKNKVSTASFEVIQKMWEGALAYQPQSHQYRAKIRKLLKDNE